MLKIWHVALQREILYKKAYDRVWACHIDMILEYSCAFSYTS